MTYVFRRRRGAQKTHIWAVGNGRYLCHTRAEPDAVTVAAVDVADLVPCIHCVTSALAQGKLTLG